MGNSGVALVGKIIVLCPVPQHIYDVVLMNRTILKSGWIVIVDANQIEILVLHVLLRKKYNLSLGFTLGFQVAFHIEATKRVYPRF